ncbi:DUF6807 domain-containing protein [Euzebyella saccharophila]|uniref:PmoA family protein n=1 Tax=Euzebyella saccharophila TaxID=679664 RepID=A0ABV8JZ14_9FLAO|nr:PmoA family protein [Euzebyella saccharophila]
MYNILKIIRTYLEKFILYCLALIIFLSASCEKEKSLEFAVAKGNGIPLNQPRFVEEDELKSNGLQLDSSLVLVTANGNEVPYQQEDGKLWFIAGKEEESSFKFANRQGKSTKSNPFRIEKESGDLTVQLNGKSAISYRYGMRYPPEGVDSLYEKSGYVHPIITPKGDTLTRIQPEDHYHHYGLWGPWTHTQVNGQRVDFWNLREGMGTVLFKNFKSETSGKLFSSFTASQEHIDLKTQENPQIALNEDVTIKVWDINRPDRYMFDYITNFSSPLKKGILFEAYRYGGGLGLRFHERWKADNCTVLTSEGNDRATADGTNAKWCIVTGESTDGKGTSGILFLSHPSNRNHPEPMRIWPLDANGGRGDMFFEFCPIRHEEWKIEPNEEYGLTYRMIVFDGELTAQEAETYWQNFANEPKIEVTKN